MLTHAPASRAAAAAARAAARAVRLARSSAADPPPGSRSVRGTPDAEDPLRSGDHVWPESMRTLPDPEDAYRKERRVSLNDDQPPRGAGKAPDARWYEAGRGSGDRSAGDAAAAGADANEGDAPSAAGGGDQPATISGILSQGCEAAAAAAAAARRPKAV